MRKAILALFLAVALAPTAGGQNLRLDIQAALRGSPDIVIFRGEMLLPPGQVKEIFTGPFTLKLSADREADRGYQLYLDIFGLGPEFKNYQYKMPIAPGDPMVIPPLTLKDSSTVKYTIMLLDDTTAAIGAEPPLDDSIYWGQNQSVHYNTHWVRNSLADFMWNLKIGYLEQVYNLHRKSFNLSQFDKIEFYIHAQPTNTVYLDPQNFYSVQPRKNRIDVVFNQRINSLDPRPGFEFVLYKYWGYGPRWTVTGFAGYYFDMNLRARNIITGYTSEKLDALFGDKAWIDSDTGQVITGAFVHWLLEVESVTKFERLYKQSTELDFRDKFAAIYGKPFVEFLRDFIACQKTYTPKEGELGYYASLYTQHENYEQAAAYLKEIVERNDANSNQFRRQLALCLFWLGDYKEALANSKPGIDSANCSADIFNANLEVASGVEPEPGSAYRHLSDGAGCDEAKLNLISAYLDDDKTDPAEKLFNKLGDEIKASPDYYIQAGRLRIMQGQPADSILTVAASMALTRAQNVSYDPMNYFTAGQALLLMGRYEKARENLDLAYFLEHRPYFEACILLEQGKLSDLVGERAKAGEYYRSVVEFPRAGAYQKMLAEKYLENKYALR